MFGEREGAMIDTQEQQKKTTTLRIDVRSYRLAEQVCDRINHDVTIDVGPIELPPVSYTHLTLPTNR